MKVFISHITEEAPIARVLKEWIESTFPARVVVFVSSSRTDLPAGSRWLEVIDEALSTAQLLLVICSPQSIRRPWIHFEAGCGWIKRVPIIPVCHSGQRKHALPAPLSLFQALEVESDGFPTQLLTAVAHHTREPEIPRIRYEDMARELKSALVSIGTEDSFAANRADADPRSLCDALTGLTKDECKVFIEFVDKDSKVATFAMMDGGHGLGFTAHALATRGFLYVLSRRSNLWFTEITYTIQEPVFAFLSKNPELLEKGRGET